MAKKYNNIIETGAGFKYTGAQPLDDRDVVEQLADLTALDDSNLSYEGQDVYVIAKNASFKKIGNNWVQTATIEDIEELEDSLPQLIADQTTAAMEFKGATASLPTTGTNGDMYKVSGSFEVLDTQDAQGTGFTTQVGDSIVCDTQGKWYLIPSGDDIEDTWRPVTDVNNDSTLTFAAGDKLDVAVAAGGTITYKHVSIDDPKLLAENEQTRTYITEVETDGFGHVTGYKTATESVEDTNTTYTFESQSDEATSVYFQVKSSDEESSEVIYFDAYSKNEADLELAKKVNKETDKSLVLDTEIAKLAGIAPGANKVETLVDLTDIDWNSVNGKIKIDGEEKIVYQHPESVLAGGMALDLYKVSTDTEGHIDNTSFVTAEDIANLGVAITDTVYTHPEYTAYESNIYKVTVDTEGHVSNAEEFTASDVFNMVGCASLGSEGFMSIDDFVKLQSIEESAQVNVIESIKIGDTAATIEDKTVTMGTLAGKSKVNMSDLGDDLLGEINDIGSTAREAKDTADNTLGIELPKKADKADTLAGYGIGDAYTKTETDEAVQGAKDYAKSLVDAIPEQTDYTVRIEEDTTDSTIAKRYIFKQLDKEIGRIDLAKELVVTSGSVKEVTSADAPYTGAKVGDKYIELVIANQDAPIYVPAKDLVDIYTPAADAAEVQVAISNTNEISATLVDGGVTEKKLDKAVQTKLNKTWEEVGVAQGLVDALAERVEATEDALQNYATAESVSQLSDAIAPIAEAINITDDNELLVNMHQGGGKSVLEIKQDSVTTGFDPGWSAGASWAEFSYNNGGIYHSDTSLGSCGDGYGSKVVVGSSIDVNAAGGVNIASYHNDITIEAKGIDEYTSNINLKTPNGGIVINDGAATGKYSIAGGTTNKEFIEGVVGSTVASITTLHKSEARGPLSIALGADNVSNTAGSITMGYDNISGGKGYYFDDIDFTNRIITLSSTRRASTLVKPTYPSSVNWSKGDKLFIVNDDRYWLEVESVNGNKVTVKELPFSSIEYESTLTVFTYSKPNDRSIINVNKPENGVVDIGWGAFGIGTQNTVVGSNSYAVGYKNTIAGDFGTAFGQENIVGYSAFATGIGNQATGRASHAEGDNTQATASCTHAEGAYAQATGYTAHAEGDHTVASAPSAHAEGVKTIASGPYSHAEGNQTRATNEEAHAEGYQTEASGAYSHAEGSNTYATARDAHAEGHNTVASGEYSHTQGQSTRALNAWTHSEGYGTIAGDIGTPSVMNLEVSDARASHAEGTGTHAKGPASHAEGIGTITEGKGSHAEGYYTVASGNYAHAQGYKSTASKECAHAEGIKTEASGPYSHAEGNQTKATNEEAHAEGYMTEASGAYSHAEGSNTVASNRDAHAEGHATLASGAYSHAGGIGTIASGDAQTAIGKYNAENSNALFIVGKGSSDTNRSNAFEVLKDGTAKLGDNLVATSQDISDIDSRKLDKTGGTVIGDFVLHSEIDDQTAYHYESYFKLNKNAVTVGVEEGTQAGTSYIDIDKSGVSICSNGDSDIGEDYGHGGIIEVNPGTVSISAFAGINIKTFDYGSINIEAGIDNENAPKQDIVLNANYGNVVIRANALKIGNVELTEEKLQKIINFIDTIEGGN